MSSLTEKAAPAPAATPAPAARIDFVFFDAGGGHRAAATALRAVIEQQQRPWQVRLVNLQEVLDSLDIFRKLTGIRFQDVYNKMLKNGWTLGSAQLVPLMHAVIRLYHGRQVRMLEPFWRLRAPDMVVSVVPNFNRALCESLRRVCPRAPFVTVLTDLADYPPHFWIERQQPQYIICGTAKAAAQARALGHPKERIFQTSGMVLRPSFYGQKPVDRRRERERLGLRADVPTGLVMFGGQGARVMLPIARRLQQVRRPLQLILICGQNEKLARELKSLSSSIGMHVEGFTTEVPYFMQLSDFLIGKPGPGTISEALAMNLPVIVERNAWTLPQERYNAEWIVENEVGLVVGNFRGIAEAVERMLKPETLARFQANARGLENRAIFEIPDILARIQGFSGQEWRG